MELILLVNIIIVVVGALLTKRYIPKRATRIFLWSGVFIVLVIVEFIFISNAINSYYSKQHYLNKKELSGFLDNVQKNLVARREEAFANSELVFEGYPLKIEKIDKNKHYAPSAIDRMSKTQYLREKSKDPKFDVIFSVQKLVKGRIIADTFNVLVYDPKMTFAFAGFDIGWDGTIKTRIPFRVYINSNGEMIYNDMVLRNAE